MSVGHQEHRRELHRSGLIHVFVGFVVEVNPGLGISKAIAHTFQSFGFVELNNSTSLAQNTHHYLKKTFLEHKAHFKILKC